MQSAPLIDDGVHTAYKRLIPSHADFPVPGIDFKDLAPLFADGEQFAATCDGLCERLEGVAVDFDAVLAVESRGFVVGAPIASRLRRGLIMVRKPGKLPGATDKFGYTCEYGSGTMEVREGAVVPGSSYLVLDDVLATGGTARAVADHVARMGGVVAGYCFLVELSFLDGRARLGDAPVVSLIVY